MNCRRINSLLSAYIDRELTGTDMLEVRQHLRDCPVCQLEHQSLQDTKRLLNCLAQKLPRPELESLLLAHAVRSENPVQRWMPRWLSELGAAIRPLPVPRLTPALGAAMAVAGLVIISFPLDRGTNRVTQDYTFVPVSAAPLLRYGAPQQESIASFPVSSAMSVNVANTAYGDDISPIGLGVNAVPGQSYIAVEKDGIRAMMVVDQRTRTVRFYRLRPTPPLSSFPIFQEQ